MQHMEPDVVSGIKTEVDELKALRQTWTLYTQACWRSDIDHGKSVAQGKRLERSKTE